MRRFSISRKLRERFRAPTPLEVEHPPPIPPSKARKWFLRIASLLIFGGLLIIIFKEFLTYRFSGVVEPEKSVIYSTVPGRFKPRVKVGDDVEKGQVIGVIENPVKKQEIKALRERIEKLKELKEELLTAGRKAVKREESLTLLRVPSVKALEKEIRVLEGKKRELLMEEEELKEKAEKVRELIKKGYATLYDLAPIENRLKKIKDELAKTEVELEKAEEELKKTLYLARVGEPPNPLLPAVASVESQIEQIKALIEKLKEESSYKIIAPFKARVSYLFPPDSTITSGEKIAELLKERSYRVIAYVPPKVVNKLKVGDKALVKLPSGKVLKGEIVKVRPQLILKPFFLVGPLEKRELNGEVEIILKEGEDAVYENLPVTVVIPKLQLKLFGSGS